MPTLHASLHAISAAKPVIFNSGWHVFGFCVSNFCKLGLSCPALLLCLFWRLQGSKNLHECTWQWFNWWKLITVDLVFLFGLCGFVTRNSAMWIKVVFAVYSDFFNNNFRLEKPKTAVVHCSCEDSLRRTQKKVVFLPFQVFQVL